MSEKKEKKKSLYQRAKESLKKKFVKRAGGKGKVHKQYADAAKIFTGR